MFASTLKIRLENPNHNDEDKTLLLQAGANILSKYYHNYGHHFTFLQDYYNCSTNKDLVADLKMLIR
jgi:hypothetical protein